MKPDFFVAGTWLILDKPSSSYHIKKEFLHDAINKVANISSIIYQRKNINLWNQQKTAKCKVTKWWIAG